MLARARFLAMPKQDESGTDSDAAQRIFVPQSAVTKRNGADFVWLADQVEQRAHLQAIELGRTTSEDWIVANRGLNPGDRVIVDAPSDLEEGQRIRIQED
jgi:multidrug efflux pump subunit AcrA (membrane-fusion protein)